MIFFWIFLLVFTAMRLLLAAMGHISGEEAYLMMCAHHLDWGFVEGPAGVPALIRATATFCGWSSFGVRLLSPLMLLLASWMLFRLAHSLYGRKVALWSVVAFNLLPLANVAALIMDGTMVVVAAWMLALESAWFLVSTEKTARLRWIFFGLILAMGTQVSYALGWLLPVVLFWELSNRKIKENILRVGIGLFLFLLGWVGPLWWNRNQDWLQWSDVTWGSFWSWQAPSLEIFYQSPLLWIVPLLLPILFLGLYSLKNKKRDRRFFSLIVVPILFCLGAIGHHHPAFALQLVVTAVLLPGVVDFFLQRKTGKIALGVLGVISLFSLLLLSGIVPEAEGSSSSWTIPNVRGVAGLQKVAVEILRLRALKTSDAGQAPFIIAQTPSLAAILGTVLPISYPERSGAPPVFTPESPAFTSQFQLWPHYADAVATAVIDPLYTEEKETSPFLGRNAFYVTTESLEELPQTIRGAFAAVEPLGEVMLKEGGRAESLFIYDCRNYQMLAL